MEIMELGVNILNFGRYADPAALLGWARFAEDTGFGCAMISDHVAVTPDVAEQYEAPFYDPFTALAWLAAQTSRIELGTTVTILPYRHPLQTARITANIDQLSGGRLILGVAAGWARQEYAALGVPYERRGDRTTEYLEVIKRAWTNDVISFRGEFVSFDEVATAPRPASSPHPPIWAGGNSLAAIRRAARLGDAWHPINARLDWLRDEGIPALHAAAEAAKRPVPALAPRIPLRLTETPLGPDRLPGQGSLDQIRADIDAFAELGATHLLFDTYPGRPDQLRSPEDDQRMLIAIAEKLGGPGSP
jgi:probable F420-dependent oxidoreductase